MEVIINFVKGIPLLLLIAVPSAIVLILLLTIILVSVIKKNAFIARLKKVIEKPDSLNELIKSRYSDKALLKRSKVIENFAKNINNNIIWLTGIDELWIERLVTRKKIKDFNRVLNYASEKGLFKCFLVSMEKKEFAPVLIKWLEESSDMDYLRKVALSGKGEQFEGNLARNIFSERLYEVREMTGDPEWASRYFAIKILLHDSGERSVRAIWDAFKDSHPLIRKTAINEFYTEQRKALYDALKNIVINDPVYEVRKAAWDRIHKDFKDLYILLPENLKEDEAFHVLELLRKNIKEDENFAMYYLKSKNLEVRYAAASYLDKCGALARLTLSVDLGDREGLDRSNKLLQNASEVNVTGFLSVIEKTDNPGTLLLCSRILSEKGDRDLIVNLCKKVFSHVKSATEDKELYQASLMCIFKRGNESAYKLLNAEMQKRKSNPELMALILPLVPVKGEYVYLDTLISLLKDEKFEPKSELYNTLKRMTQSLVLPVLFQIIQAERGVYPHKVRMSALKILGDLKLSYCLRTILEYLPILPIDEARDFAKILSEYPRNEFIAKVNELLKYPDAKIRASIISALPATGESSFLKQIKESLKDADPDVRITSVWALVDYGDTRSLNLALEMLRDPVERVRVEIACALGAHGSKEIIGSLKTILNDKNETDSVKKAAIIGLGTAEPTNSIDILIDRLEVEEELVSDIVTALSLKIEKKKVMHLVEHFKDANPQLRERITEAFKGMKEKGESTLSNLLREDIASLNPYIAEILESTGYVESLIRTLKHRDPNIRRESAELLSMIGTQSAFRGIVRAARDPDDEVRVIVTRALEKLETEDGKEILSALKNDPDKRVRKYTFWALERLKAKSL